MKDRVETQDNHGYAMRELSTLRGSEDDT